jgi:peptidyl-prolyl cis-trans isomerase-like 4
MAVAGEGDARGAGSQFFLTLAPDLDYLDGKHAPFGKIVEGEDVLAKINEALCDQSGRPLRDIRIRHVIVLGKSRHEELSLRAPRTTPLAPRPQS